MDLFDFIIILGIGYFIGKFHTLLTLRSAIKELAEREGLDFDAEMRALERARKGEEEVKIELVHKLKVEKIGEILYLYDEDDDFVCQASSLEDLAMQAKEYKQIILAAVLYNDKTFMFVNGNSKEFKDED
jgi:hypothetical protein